LGVLRPEEREIEEFLERQTPIVQKFLRGEEFTREDVSALQRREVLDSICNAEDEYLKLLPRCPKELREYRRRKLKAAASRLPAVPSGAPRKDALAAEALELHVKMKMSYARIAVRLNGKYGDGTTTREAIRKLIDRKRKSGSGKA
jgi:hypothetical protein